MIVVIKIEYARVSTFEQKLESQIEVLKEARAEEVFQEKFPGTKCQQMLAFLFS